MLLASMTTKRRPAGSVSPWVSGSIRRSSACTHGPHARKRSATAWSVMVSYSAVKVPATSRKDLSKPQYKKTTRKSCSGVLTFLARTKALNSRAICAVSGGRSCKSSSKSVSGSVRGNCMACFSCGREGHMFPPCSMPSFPTMYSLSWRLCPTPRHGDRPWEIVHLDHTELDIELVSSLGTPLGRPYATFATDAYSRRLLACYLSFDPPSYRSCMMVLRACVRRHQRFPQMVVVDGGP